MNRLFLVLCLFSVSVTLAFAQNPGRASQFLTSDPDYRSPAPQPPTP